MYTLSYLAYSMQQNMVRSTPIVIWIIISFLLLLNLSYSTSILQFV